MIAMRTRSEARVLARLTGEALPLDDFQRRNAGFAIHFSCKMLSASVVSTAARLP